MKRTWNYNELKNNRVKSIVFGLIMMIVLFLFAINSIANIKNQVSINSWVILTIISLFPILFFYYFPMRQVIELLDNSEFATYYNFGWLKLNYKKYSLDGNAVTITQDNNRYYCLTIKTRQEGNIIIEKFPTLDSVTTRADELKKIFGLEMKSI